MPLANCLTHDRADYSFSEQHYYQRLQRIVVNLSEMNLQAAGIAVPNPP